MKSILAIVDKPGWAVDNQVGQLMAGLPQFLWRKVFHDTEKDLVKVGRKYDLIWCANHGSGPRFREVFEELKHPRVLVTFRSWRYSEKAISFIQSGMVHEVSAVSPQLMSHLYQYKMAVHYIPEAVPDLFRPSRPRRIGFVGVVDEYKGFPIIKQAVENCGFELLVAPRLSDQYGVNVPQSEMPTFYESCDAIVVASEQEGGGTIAMEAMAMNVPVLTTRVGVASNLDCLYIGRSVDGIEAGLRRLFGRSKVFPEFSVETVNSQYAKLFEDMLK